MSPFRIHSVRKIKEGGDSPYPGYAMRGCKHHLKWTTDAFLTNNFHNKNKLLRYFRVIIDSK